jgi:hypothetical protein
MLDMSIIIIASCVSPAASVPGLPISPLWGTAGIALLVESKSYAHGFNGALTAPCLSSREACTTGPINESWVCSPTTRLFENRARATLERKGPTSIALISGASAEAGLWRLVDGRSANPQLAGPLSGSPRLGGVLFVNWQGDSFLARRRMVRGDPKSRS